MDNSEHRSSRRLSLLAATLAVCLAVAAPAWGAVKPPQMHTLASSIGQAAGVAALPGGGFLYVDSSVNNYLVKEVASGSTTTVAGNGTATDAPDGTVAVNSGLNGPVGAAPTPDGGFLITEKGGSVIRLVSPGPPGQATISTIAGTGTPAINNSAGPATSVPLNYPEDAAADSNGSVVIADTGNGLIRLVSSGTMFTIAGGGSCDDSTTSCEGLPATSVKLDHPVSVSPIQGGAGGYLIAENDTSGASAIREISPSGAFTTVAGTPGTPGSFGGDGGPATSAQLRAPQHVASTSDGGFLIADSGNARIRKVSASGTITTVAGNGSVGSGGDGGAATAASLVAPAGVSPTSDGGLLIADAGAGTIRAVTIPPVTTFATLSPTSPDGDHGWYRTSPVLATAKATEHATIRCELDPVQPPPAFDAIPPSCPYLAGGGPITGDGVHTLYAASVNSYGDKELPVSFSVKLDTTPPTVKCLPARFILGQFNAFVTATIADAIAGPAQPLASAPADTSSLGFQHVLVTGLNNAGLNATVSCAYTVHAAALNPTPVARWTFSYGRNDTSVRSLVVTHAPVGSTVRVLCKGTGCPPTTVHRVSASRCRGRQCKSPRSATVVLTSLFAHPLAVGTSLSVSVTKPNTTGRVWVFAIRAAQSPSHRVTCLAPGSSTPGRGC